MCNLVVFNVRSVSKIPRVLWAQRSDIVYVTIEVVDTQEEKIEITNQGLKFSAIQGSTGDKYSVDLEFYAEVDGASTQQHKTDRCFTFVFKKVDTEQPYWQRLLKTGKPHYVHTDFSRWKDEDDDDETSPPGGMDFSQFANMAGSGGFPMGEDDDETDEVDSDGEEKFEEEDPYQKTSKEALVADE